MKTNEIVKQCRKLARENGYVFRQLSATYNGKSMYGMYNSHNIRVSVATSLKTWELILYGEIDGAIGYLGAGYL